MGLQEELLENIRQALAHHNATCPLPALAILINPASYDLLEREELWGIPVRADQQLAARRFRIECDGSAHGVEEELAAITDEVERRKIQVAETSPTATLRCYWNFTDAHCVKGLWEATPHFPSH